MKLWSFKYLVVFIFGLVDFKADEFGEGTISPTQSATLSVPQSHVADIF